MTLNISLTQQQFHSNKKSHNVINLICSIFLTFHVIANLVAHLPHHTHPYTFFYVTIQNDFLLFFSQYWKFFMAFYYAESMPQKARHIEIFM